MPFRYLRDPLFLFCLGLYFVNRWVLKPHLPVAFFRDHLNDLICIPFWLPIMLWAMRRLGLRRDDRPPHWYEILVPLLIWSWLFEVLLPGLGPFRGVAVADPADVLSYTAGALLAAIIWRLERVMDFPRERCAERERRSLGAGQFATSTAWSRTALRRRIRRSQPAQRREESP
jgi:hypothetical protein